MAPHAVTASLAVALPARHGERRIVRWGAYLKELAARAEVVDDMMKCGALDADYYSVQTGQDFLSPEAALSHYLDVGEASGLAPNPFFEPEWYAAHAKGRQKVGGGLLAFWLSGQTGSTAPQFDGSTYVTQRCGGQHPPEGAWAHFLGHAAGDDPAPASTDIRPQQPRVSRAVVMETARSIADDQQRLRLRRVPPPMSPAARQATSATPIGVVIDARSLHPRKPLAPVLEQTHSVARAIVIVPHDRRDVAMSPAALAALLEESRVELVQSREGETFGATVSRAVADTPLVSFWNPEQQWATDFLAQAAVALDADDQLMAVTARKRAGWLTQVDPLWSELDMATGVVIRHKSVPGGIAARSLDGGVEWDLLLRLDVSRVRAIPARLIRTAHAWRKPYDLQNPRRWTNVVRARHLLPELEARTARVDHRTSVLIPTFEDWSMTITAVRAALDAAGGIDVEVVVLDNGSRPAVSRLVAGAFAGDHRVVLRRAPLNTDFALGSNLALAASTGQNVIFLNNDTAARPGSIPALIAALDAGAAAVQPLLIYPSGTVQAAGTVFLGQAVPPVHLLANFPVEDVHHSLADVEFRALTAACLAMRATDALDLGGFDPAFVNGMEDLDLCLRLIALDRGPLRLVPSAVVLHHESQTPGRMDRALQNRAEFVRRWREHLTTSLDDRAVLDTTHLRIDGVRSTRQASQSTIRRSELQIVRPLRTVATGPAAGLPCLRWAIKTAVPGVEHDHRWGDLFFANDLAAALRRLGQEVVVDRLPAHVRPESDHLDDVVVAMRGVAEFQPQPRCTNLMWVISHPDDVSDAELNNGWDRIYAAGPTWAERTTRRSGVPVHAMLQATAPARFAPRAASGSTIAHDVLFVGNTRRIFRPVVRDALAAGADLAVYGTGWAEYIDPTRVIADRLPNEQLPGAYAASRIVLNDHWADMAANGFLSNRLFDAAASGARVITDHVTGIDSVFGANVRVYHDPDELRVLLDPANPGWPSDEQRAVLAAEIAQLHSFDARAATLVSDVLDLRGVAHSLTPTSP